MSHDDGVTRRSTVATGTTRVTVGSFLAVNSRRSFVEQDTEEPFDEEMGGGLAHIPPTRHLHGAPPPYTDGGRSRPLSSTPAKLDPLARGHDLAMTAPLRVTVSPRYV
jgi:hypothetical protein